MEDEDEEQTRITQLSARSPGEDNVNPYEDVNINELPAWWRQAIETFEANDLRPYRPPRFEDGTLKHEVVEYLEDKLDIDIRFVCFNARHGDDWDVFVDNERIGKVGHRRSPEGYSVFEVESEEFESLVRLHVLD